MKEIDRFDPFSLSLLLDEPLRLTDVLPWQPHIPFAFVLVELAEPRSFVELGTARGDSYCAFCQAISVLGLEACATAVDTWLGDTQSGELDLGTFEELRTHHDPLYGRFSRLRRTTFDDAALEFQDGTIDLLHIDGCHVYEAVRHDFATWLPKMSERGVMVLHDVAVHDGDFGVWRLWDEVSSSYPSFAFTHGYGLGVLAVGARPPGRVLNFIETASTDGGRTDRLFATVGERLSLRSRTAILERALEVERGRLRAAIDAERHLAGLLETRTFRYTHWFRAAYGEIRSRIGRGRATY
jgi:hypothetical protein